MPPTPIAVEAVRITSVDSKNQVVNFYGADGFARSLPVRTREISKIYTGDEIEIIYTEAVGGSAEPST